MRLLPRIATVVAVVTLLVGTGITDATASYSASGNGSGDATAAALPEPPSPSITGITSVLGTACLIGLSWAAPPTGEEFTITRTIGTTGTVIESDQTTSGSVTDTVALSLLTGEAPSYTITAFWVKDTAWTAGPSAGVEASECLSLL